MTFTRIWQSGAELQHVNEFDEYAVATWGASSGAVISSVSPKTGSYCLRMNGNSYPRGKSATWTQMRAAVYFRHSSVLGTSALADIFVIPCSGISAIECLWNSSLGNLELYTNTTTLRASINVGTAGFTTTNKWYHVGVTHFANASTGFVTVYLDGVAILTYTGNTGTAGNGIYWGGYYTPAGQAWNNYVDIDDFYLDSAASESNAAPTTKRFFWLPVSGAGDSAAWTATGATPNYACVDETSAPNDDTDYVSVAAASTDDYYATSDVAIPTGNTVAAVIPVAWAKKSDAATASQIKLGSRLSSTNSFDSAKDLTTTYGMVFGRITAKPGGGAWTETDVNNGQIAVESAGTF